MRKLWIGTLLIGALSTLSAESEYEKLRMKKYQQVDDTTFTLRYFKAGMQTGPQNLAGGLGLGYREHESNHGYDASIVVKSKNLDSNWASLKVSYLNYPFSEYNQLFYLGMGGGVNYFYMTQEALQKQVNGEYQKMVKKTPDTKELRQKITQSAHVVYPGLDFCIGYEIFSNFKSHAFIQLEANFPILLNDLEPWVENIRSLRFQPLASIGVGF